MLVVLGSLKICARKLRTVSTISSGDCVKSKLVSTRGKAPLSLNVLVT